MRIMILYGSPYICKLLKVFFARVLIKDMNMLIFVNFYKKYPNGDIPEVIMNIDHSLK